MDYEKKYKEAMEDASYWIKEKPECKELLQSLFPELTESEDERIRKDIIKTISWIVPDCQYAIVLPREQKNEWLAWLERQKEQGNEEGDFTIYHPLKNGKGEYECIPYSFNGSLTSFSEDKDLIDFLRTCFYTKEECNEWIEQQKEQKSNIEICPHFIKSKSYKETGYPSVTKFVYNKSDEEFIRDCANILKGNDYGVSAERLLSMIEQKPADEQDYSELSDFERAIHRGFLCAGVDAVGGWNNFDVMIRLYEQLKKL